MANNPSAKKRARQNHKRRLANRYKLVKSRNSVRKFMALTDKAAAQQMYTDVISTIDRLAKDNIIHDNKAARHKHQLTVRLNTLGA